MTTELQLLDGRGSRAFYRDLARTEEHYFSYSHNLTLVALSAAVRAADEALLATFGKVNPTHSGGWTEFDEIRGLIFQMRCAFAHGAVDPYWHADSERGWARVFSMPTLGVTLDPAALDGISFDPMHVGGYNTVIDMLTWCKQAIEGQEARANQ